MLTFAVKYRHIQPTYGLREGEDDRFPSAAEEEFRERMYESTVLARPPRGRLDIAEVVTPLLGYALILKSRQHGSRRGQVLSRQPWNQLAS